MPCDERWVITGDDQIGEFRLRITDKSCKRDSFVCLNLHGRQTGEGRTGGWCILGLIRVDDDREAIHETECIGSNLPLSNLTTSIRESGADIVVAATCRIHGVNGESPVFIL